MHPNLVLPTNGLNDIESVAAFSTESSVVEDLLGNCQWSEREVSVRFREKSSAVRTMREITRNIFQNFFAWNLFSP